MLARVPRGVAVNSRSCEKYLQKSEHSSEENFCNTHASRMPRNSAIVNARTKQMHSALHGREITSASWVLAYKTCLLMLSALNMTHLLPPHVKPVHFPVSFAHTGVYNMLAQFLLYCTCSFLPTKRNTILH